uniref:hypothetical protein n=1 Tax=Cohaesibacter celericrescens TaxID=2067669 RepID=UPI003564FBD7
SGTMSKSTDHIFAAMQKAIQDATASRQVFNANSLSGRVAVAQNCADIMQSVTDAYTTFMIDLAGECVSCTGNGSLSEAEDFREMVKEDATEKLIHEIRQDAWSMQRDIHSHGFNGIAAE